MLFESLDFVNQIIKNKIRKGQSQQFNKGSKAKLSEKAEIMRLIDFQVQTYCIQNI